MGVGLRQGSKKERERIKVFLLGSVTVHDERYNFFLETIGIQIYDFWILWRKLGILALIPNLMQNGWEKLGFVVGSGEEQI